MRVALIRNGLVDNVILADSSWKPPAGVTRRDLSDDSPVGPGWRYLDGDFVGPGQTQPPSDDPAPVVDVVQQIAALQAWARDIQSQVDAATEILMGGLA